MTSQSSPLLRLPTELRLQILSYLLHNTPTNNAFYDQGPCGTAALYYNLITYGTPEFSNDSESFATGSPRTIKLHTLSPIIPPQSHAQRRRRYPARSRQFPVKHLSTTYGLASAHRIEAAILATCRQLHLEGAEMLYRHYTFTFGTDVEAMTAFLHDLTPVARAYMRSIHVVKTAGQYDEADDRRFWSEAMTCLRMVPNLSDLKLGVMALKPVAGGWAGIKAIRSSEFAEMVEGDEEFEWVRALIRGSAECRLRTVQVEAVETSCPIPTGEEAWPWLRVSRSVEGGLREFLCDALLRKAVGSPAQSEIG